MSLYPSFEPPSMFEEGKKQIDDVVAPKFNQDDERLDINGVGQAVIGDEKDAYRFWVMKCLLTERYRYPAYSSDFGVEIEAIVKANYPRSVAESEIQRTITEALMVDDRTISVNSFVFEWEGDSLWTTFIVESIFDSDKYELMKGGETIGKVNIRPA
jgi:hypothetical protein